MERRVYGTHAVLEWLRADRGHLRAVHYAARSTDRLRAVLDAATAAGVTLRSCSDEALAELAGTAHHQGVVATAPPFPYAALESVISAAPQLVVLADQMQDPHNLGAVLRTAEAVGAGAVIIPKDGSVPVTASVEATAAGAAARIPVCRVTNAARTLQSLKQHGYWILGLVARRGTDLYQLDPFSRVVVVVGGETGLRPLVARCCDLSLSIPMGGHVESLNASVAVAVALFELRRRWRGGGR
jgi:23S rRNA (guanosine2251-2'-O)-methyltransferase